MNYTQIADDGNAPLRSAQKANDGPSEQMDPSSTVISSGAINRKTPRLTTTASYLLSTSGARRQLYGLVSRPPVPPGDYRHLYDDVFLTRNVRSGIQEQRNRDSTNQDGGDSRNPLGFINLTNSFSDKRPTTMTDSRQNSMETINMTPRPDRICLKLRQPTHQLTNTVVGRSFVAPELAVVAERLPVKQVWQAGPERTSDSRLAPRIKSAERERELETFKLEADEMVRAAQRQVSRDLKSANRQSQSRIRTDVTGKSGADVNAPRIVTTKDRNRWNSAPWATEKPVNGGSRYSLNNPTKNTEERNDNSVQQSAATERVQFDVHAINNITAQNNDISYRAYERRTHPATLDSSITPSKASRTENQPQLIQNRPPLQQTPMFKHKRSKVGAVLDTSDGRPLCKSKSQPILHDMTHDINNAGYQRSTQAANGKAVGNGGENKEHEDSRDVDEDELIDEADDVSDDIEEAMKTAWILKWLSDVEAGGTERPESPFIDEDSPQTDTAIHIVYTGD